MATPLDASAHSQCNAGAPTTEANDMPKKPMETKRGPAFVRWTPSEYLAVAVNALEFDDKHMPLLEVINKGQRLALTRYRWRDAKGFSSQQQGTFREYLAKARALTPKGREALLVKAPEPAEPVPEPVKAKADAIGRKFSVRWTLMEKAKVAHALKATEGQPLAYTKRIELAQMASLAPERWITRGSISGACAPSGSMRQHMAEGAANEWLLKEKEAEALTEVATGSDAIDLEAPGTLLQRAQESVAPPVPGGLTEALQAFANAMNGAVTTLMQATAAHTLASLDAKLGEVAASIAARLHNDMRDTVLETMAAELGGPVSPPPEPKAPAEAPMAQAAVAPGVGHRLKVDVIGLPDNEAAAVKRAFNGNTDLRIMTTEHAHHWMPRTDCTVIQNTRIMSHKVSDRLKKHGVKPIRVTGGPSVVIAAIEALHQSAGITAH